MAKAKAARVSCGWVLTVLMSSDDPPDGHFDKICSIDIIDNIIKVVSV